VKLYAISDLHLAYEVTRDALCRIEPRPDDGLVLAGDVGETETHLRFALEVVVPRFRTVFWTPGNHELWTLPRNGGGGALRGEAKYLRLVEVCRQYGVVTPEDPYVLWRGEGGPCWVAPTFVLYDYTFRPAEVAEEHAVRWAAASGIVCADEELLHPDPYASRAEWCRARCASTEARLDALDPAHPIVLVNHFPVLEELAATPLIPRFSTWCGTHRTASWHRRFRIATVVYGHVHIRRTTWRDGVRFEEVSLGYPRQWRQERGIGAYLREILPGPQGPPLA
jgi:3',5'-cyclic AMP phosphodiesterase CpdA